MITFCYWLAKRAISNARARLKPIQYIYYPPINFIKVEFELTTKEDEEWY